MAKQSTVKIDSHVEEVISAKDTAMEIALEMIGLKAEAYAKALAPVDTGRLKGSISHDKDTSAGEAYIGTNVEYAPYQEFGTKRMHAHPFLKPAVKNHIDEYKMIVEEELKGD